MSTTFGIVEDKILESEFFLRLLEDAHFFESRYYFSAFLSASRSVTYAIQKSLSGLEGFHEWYSKKQEELKKDKLAKFFFDARNETVHEAVYHINSGKFYCDEKGQLRLEFYFDSILNTGENTKINIDCITACREYFKTLLEIVLSCFINFGKIIDPEQYWSLKNLRLKGKTFEDIEEELGYPRGWTNLNGTGDNNTPLPYVEEDIVITKDKSPMEPLFIKYLGKDKFGNPVKQK